ncbi:MAG: hypothetical protein EBV48_08995 [Betaproteobacteria bacterium]|nr:hypothetical protein [Betaproteobacteria bacterium]
MHLPHIVEFRTETALRIRIELPDQLLGLLLQTVLQGLNLIVVLILKLFEDSEMLALKTLNLLMQITLEQFGLLVLALSKSGEGLVITPNQCLRLLEPLLLRALTYLVILGLLLALFFKELGLQLKQFAVAVLPSIEYLPKALALRAR